MDFKYTNEELVSMVEKLENSVNEYELQKILTLYAKEFHLFHKNNILNKKNLRLLAIKNFINFPFLINEFKFVISNEKLLKMLEDNKFLDAKVNFSHNYYQPQKKIILSFYTLFDDIMCQIIKVDNSDTINLRFLERVSDYKKPFKSIVFSFNNIEDLNSELIRLSLLGQKEFLNFFDLECEKQDL